MVDVWMCGLTRRLLASLVADSFGKTPSKDMVIVDYIAVKAIYIYIYINHQAPESEVPS